MKEKINWKQYIMLLMLIIITGLFYFLTNGKILKPMNIANLINQNAYVVILAVGMLMCILTGGNIDLSVGSVVALIGACAGTFVIEWKWSPALAIPVCLLIGIAVGIWQGFWIAYVRVPAFICTLSGMLVFRGLTLLILNGLTLAPFPMSYKQIFTGFVDDYVGKLFPSLTIMEARNITCLLIGALIALAFVILQITGYQRKKKKGAITESLVVVIIKMVVISAGIIWLFYTLSRYNGMPVVLIIVGLILIVYAFVTSKTVIGRHLYALGGNEKAARLSGVKTNRLLFLAYVNMAFLAAVAGIVYAARLDSASPTAGTSFEMDAIGSCYIGGASAYGGVGTVGGTLIGALIMGVLNNGMSIMGLNQNVVQVVKGLVLLVAVAFDAISKQKIQFPFISHLFHKTNKPKKPNIVHETSGVEKDIA